MSLPLPVPTLLVVSIVAASALIYLPFLVVVYGRVQIGMEAIATPRDVVDKLPPISKRATWAHQNAFEAFSLYTAAALTAYVTGVQSPWAGWAAITFLIGRTFYPVFYIANIPPGRSVCFGIGTASILTLFILSLQKALAG